MEIAQKLELRLEKRPEVRFISHHDMMRALSRAASRAALPVRRTEGFNPRPRMVLVHALAVGIVSEDEAVEIELSEWMRPAEVEARLGDSLPGGLAVRGSRLLRPFRKGRQLVGVEYRISLPVALSIDDECVERLMASKEALATRRRPKEVKEVNVREYIEEIELAGSELRVKLRAIGGGLARPAEVVAVLAGVDTEELKALEVVKTRTILSAQRIGN